MTIKSVLTGVLLTLVGTAATGGVFWLLLNVPESNALALILSAVLVLLFSLLAGYTTSVVLVAADGATVVQATRRGIHGLSGFLLGLALFSVLWLVTTSIDGQWTLHGGEIDALLLRYAGTSNSGWLHTGVRWLLWLVRWGVGLAVICGCTAGSVRRSGVRRGMGLALSAVPLGATLVGLLSGYGLWSLAYWRPKSLPANTAELIFVSVKLSALFALGALIVVLVLHAFSRTATTDDAAAHVLNSQV